MFEPSAHSRTPPRRPFPMVLEESNGRSRTTFDHMHEGPGVGCESG